jgi:hypothetical protein
MGPKNKFAISQKTIKSFYYISVMFLEKRVEMMWTDIHFWNGTSGRLL